jgi:hypothetical protein
MSDARLQLRLSPASRKFETFSYLPAMTADRSASRSSTW